MSWRQLREICGVLWPAALSSISFSLMEVVDTAMLGMVGVHAMAGVALGGTIIYLILAFPMFLMRAAAPLAASHRERSATIGLVRLTLLSALVLGGLATLLVLGAAAALPSLGYEHELAGAARDYMVWRAPFLAVELAFFGGWALLEGLTGTRAPMIAGLASNAANVGLNLLLIPGLGRLPALGPTGAAVATTLSMVVGLLVLAYATHRSLRRTSRGVAGLGAALLGRAAGGADRSLARRFLRIGWPLGLCGLMDVAGWLVIGLLIPRLGVAAAAAHSIIGQLITLALATAQGSGVAATLLVARALGRRDTSLARARAIATLELQVVIGLIVGAVAWIGGGVWARLFTTEGQAAAGVAQLLPFALVIIALEGPALVLTGIIEGTGRTQRLLLSTLMFDVLFGVTAAVLVVPRGSLVSFYWIWVAKDLLKVTFLLLSVGSSLRSGLLVLVSTGQRPTVPIRPRSPSFTCDLVQLSRMVEALGDAVSRGRTRRWPGFARPWRMTPLPDG